MQKHFIIISVIDYPKKKLSYTDTRSVFSVEERLAQTKQTIASVEKYAPDAIVDLVEIGLTDYKAEFSSNMSLSYTYKGGGALTAWAVRSPFKGLGETLGMLHAIHRTSFGDFCFKLSGRYELTENFTKADWDKESFNFKDSGYGYSTRLYAFPGKYKIGMYALLLGTLPFLLCNVSIERLYKIVLPKNILKLQKILGVRGQIAVDRTYIEE